LKARTVPSTLYDGKYYECSCGDFDLFAETGGRYLARKKQFIVSMAMVRPGMRLLDAGCGRGEFSAHLAGRGAAVDAVDYSKDSVAITRDTLGRFKVDDRVRVTRCDARALPFPAASFDRIVMADIVEHMHEWELDEAFAEIARVLEPGGVLVVHTAPNRWRDIYNWPFKRVSHILRGKPIRRERRTAGELELHVNIQSPRTLARHLSKHFAYRVWTMRPELLYPMSAYERFRACDPMNVFGSRDIWALAVHPSRGAEAVRRHLRDSFFANRMITMGVNEQRFVRRGFGKWIDGEPVLRPIKKRARIEIPVHGEVSGFEIELQSEGPADLRIKADGVVDEKIHVHPGTKRTLSYDFKLRYRYAVVPVTIDVDGGEVRLARIGFV
jgi:SAM-dependent methyltransferase